MNEPIKVSKGKIAALVIAIIALVTVCCIPKIFEDVPNNKITVNQRLWSGQMDYWTKPGLEYQGFGTLTEYHKTNQAWFNQIEEDANGNLFPAKENGAFPITYADKGNGFVLGSVRIELPTNPAKLQLIQEHYGSEDRLIEELIKPTIGKVMLACGPLMTSLESVSEKRNDLIYYATDQLNSGIYATRAQTIERLNSITNEMEKIQQAYIITDSAGIPKRQEESPFDKYGLRVSQLSIANLKYEKATNDQISKQRSADMEIITAKAEASKAIQKTIQIEEEGKQAAKSAQWEQEAIKAKAVTAAEQAFQVAQLQAKEADEVAKRILAEGRAEAEANRLKVAAGLTPLEKATIDKETKIGVARELAASNVSWVPTFMINGQGAGSNNAMDAVGLKMMMDIVERNSK